MTETTPSPEVTPLLSTHLNPNSNNRDRQKTASGDRTPPILEIIEPASNVRIGISDITPILLVRVRAIAPFGNIAQVRCRLENLDESRFFPFTPVDEDPELWTTSIPLPTNRPKSYRLLIEATDDDRDRPATSALSINFSTLDIHPPRFQIHTPQPNARFSTQQDVMIQGSATDQTGILSLEYSLDNSAWIEVDPASFQANWSQWKIAIPQNRLAVGAHTVKLRFTDVWYHRSPQTLDSIIHFEVAVPEPVADINDLIQTRPYLGAGVESPDSLMECRPNPPSLEIALC